MTRAFRVTVDVELPDGMDDSGQLVLASMILGCLGDNDVPVINFTVTSDPLRPSDD